MATGKVKSRKRSSDMYPLIELYEQSSMTQNQFCKEKNIPLHVFNYWLSKFRKGKTDSKLTQQSAGFIALDVSEQEEAVVSSIRQMRITYPDGTLLEIPL